MRSLINAKRSIMGSMDQAGNLVASGLNEKKRTIRDESGYHMQLNEVSFNQIDLKWGTYTNREEKIVTFLPDKPAIVSHFRIFSPTQTINKSHQTIAERQFVVYRESTEAYDLYVEPTKDKPNSFFELAMSDNFLNSIFTEESQFLMHLHTYSATNKPASGFIAQMSPAMYGIINDMQNSPYNGYLKGIHLEAKAIELFLMQIKELDQGNLAKQSKLNAGDIERIYAVKNYIDLYYHQPCSIISLARMAGINQMKLKNGFKELFNNTIFGYLSSVRMQEAKRLLLDEKMYVSEVADKVGYKHPHHFTAAFRRKFGMVPSDLKN